MTPHRDRVAVIVLNFNRKADLLDCLESVFRLDGPGADVVVVDNASTDGSAEAVAERFPQVHLVRNSRNLGAPGGRNAGIRYAMEALTFDHVLFLDNDTVLDRGFLSQLLLALASDPLAGMACGKAFTAYPSRVIMSAGLRVNLYTGAIYDLGAGEADRGRFDARRHVDACGAFGFLMRKEALVRLGGFDEALNPYGWEEVDLCLRARRLGYRCLYTPDAVIYHKGGKIGRGPVPAYERSKVRHYLTVLGRHTNGWQKISCAICFPFRALGIVGRLVRQGRFAVILAQFRGVWDGLLRPWISP